MDPIERAAEIKRVCTKRIVWIAALHVRRQTLLPRAHLRRRRPTWKFFFRGDLVRALPLEADLADTDAVPQRHAAWLDEIEPPLRRVLGAGVGGRRPGSAPGGRDGVETRPRSNATR